MNRTTSILLTLFLIISNKSAKSAPSCDEVEMEMQPCVTYLTKDAEQPSSSCCSGVSDLSSFQYRKEDRVEICQCLESLAGGYRDIDLSRLRELPSACGVRLTLPPISSVHFDCSQA